MIIPGYKFPSYCKQVLPVKVGNTIVCVAVKEHYTLVLVLIRGDKVSELKHAPEGTPAVIWVQSGKIHVLSVPKIAQGNIKLYQLMSFDSDGENLVVRDICLGVRAKHKFTVTEDGVTIQHVGKHVMNSAGQLQRTTYEHHQLFIDLEQGVNIKSTWFTGCDTNVLASIGDSVVCEVGDNIYLNEKQVNGVLISYT